MFSPDALAKAKADSQLKQAYVELSKMEGNEFKDALLKELHSSNLTDEYDVQKGMCYLDLCVHADWCGWTSMKSFWLTRFIGWTLLKRSVSGWQQRMSSTAIGENVHQVFESNKPQQPQGSQQKGGLP